MQAIHFSKAALKDLVSIDAYSVQEWGEVQADRYLSQLEACFVRLARNPLLGRECPEIRPGLLRIEQGKHVVFYRRLEEGLFVSRILHQSMLPLADRFRGDL